MTPWAQVLIIGCLFSTSVVVGCSPESQDRPPPFNPQTTSTSGTTGHLPGGGAGTTGDGGATGDGDADGDVARGKVERFTDVDLVLTEPYEQSADVVVLDRDDSDSISVRYDGAEFSTELTANSQWMLVAPEFDTTHLPTMTLWDGKATAPMLTIMPRSVMDEIVGGLRNPTSVNDTRSQLFVQVLDADGDEGVVGVIPTVTGGPDLAFEDRGSWSDFDDSTSESGLFVAYNILSRSVPGQDIQVILSGSVDAEFRVRLVEGAVTIVTYSVD